MTTSPGTAALDILARAEKRISGYIARRGIDAELLAICATYDRMYAAAVAPAADDLTTLVEVTSQPARRVVEDDAIDLWPSPLGGGAA